MELPARLASDTPFAEQLLQFTDSSLGDEVRSEEGSDWSDGECPLCKPVSEAGSLVQ